MSEEDAKGQGEKKYERFGRYLILDHLVDGGMAKICRARFLGEQANKIVAIKMVQPQFSKDPSFVQMFEDELKVSFGLQHPNIAQMYDYGSYQEQLYTAMEYVHGKNLKEYLDKLKEKKYVFPVEISVYIISQVCQALHYAHTFTDKLTGKPYNIIHRDISPHNIMLTYDGSVKVIDFGIAKADSNSEATQAGTIKGKLSYLAPEYLEGFDLDPRYDEFAVGITLWEMLCSRKLFQAPNDLAVLKQIQACKVPVPSSINPNVPKELDELVLKSLSKDRESRFEDMDKFNRALIKFLYSKYPDFNATDLTYFAKQLFKEDIESDQERFVEYGRIDIASYIDDMKNESSSSGDRSDQGTAASKIKGPRRNVLDLDIDDNTGVDLSLDSTDLKKAQKKSGPVTKASNGGATKTGFKPGLKSKAVGKKAAATTDEPKSATRVIGAKSFGKKKASFAVGASPQNNEQTPPPTPTEEKKLPDLPEESKTKTKVKKTDKTKTTAVKKGKAKKKKRIKQQQDQLKKKAMIAAAVIGILYFKSDLIGKWTGIYIFGKPETQRGVASSAADKKGKLILEGLNPYMEVFLDGQKVDYANMGLNLSMNKRHKLEIIQQGHLPYVVDVQLDKAKKMLTIPKLEPISSGELTSSSAFKDGTKLKLTIMGRTKMLDLPIENYRIPAGTYQGVVIDPILETEKDISFTIEENRRFTLEP